MNTHTHTGGARLIERKHTKFCNVTSSVTRERRWVRCVLCAEQFGLLSLKHSSLITTGLSFQPRSVTSVNLRKLVMVELESQTTCLRRATTFQHNITILLFYIKEITEEKVKIEQRNPTQNHYWM